VARTPDDRDALYYPASLDLVRKRVVLVGGGAIATGKVRGLLPCRPEPLVVIAPDATPYIADMARMGLLQWNRRAYCDGDLERADLAFAATDDRALNARVAVEARSRGVPILSVDDVPNCDFIAPALVRRGNLSIAISTSGRSPAMARRVRERLDAAVPASWGALLDVAAAARDALGDARREVDPETWQEALGGDVEHLAASGHQEQATALLLERLREATVGPRRAGFVSLVGAGPGDPELLTVRGLRRLQAADAVVYDRLASPELLDLVPTSAERYDVGKQAHARGPTQAEINALLVSLGRAGRRVVRLKGGDPFVFGRGGEEMLALREAGVPYEIVPGVSAAIAAPAAAEIPVTHRGLAASITIATGHAAADGGFIEPVVAQDGTLVFVMAVERLQPLVEHLLRSGRAPHEPAALVERATTPRQRVIRAPLKNIVERARAEAVEAPAVLVVGATVALGRGDDGDDAAIGHDAANGRLPDDLTRLFASTPHGA
jgi:uroporphyrin-III C-methyltransferase/precorrin-2 dehydrogenase/sirohydrochlorin ferrochelatase